MNDNNNQSVNYLEQTKKAVNELFHSISTKVGEWIENAYQQGKKDGEKETNKNEEKK